MIDVRNPSHPLTVAQADAMSNEDWMIRTINRSAEAVAAVGSMRSEIAQLKDEIADLRSAMIVLLDRST